MNIQEYSVALMTTLERNKNSTAIAREAEVSQSTSSRFLKTLSLTDKDFVPFVSAVFGKKKLKLFFESGK